jgi:hypothetical protein
MPSILLLLRFSNPMYNNLSVSVCEHLRLCITCQRIQRGQHEEQQQPHNQQPALEAQQNQQNRTDSAVQLLHNEQGGNSTQYSYIR